MCHIAHGAPHDSLRRPARDISISDARLGRAGWLVLVGVCASAAAYRAAHEDISESVCSERSQSHVGLAPP